MDRDNPVLPGSGGMDSVERDAGHWQLDIGTGDLRLSDRARSICGLSGNAPVSWRSLIACCSHQDRRRLVATARRALAGGEIASCDVHFWLPDGQHRFLRCLVLRAPGFEPPSINGVLLDQSTHSAPEFDRHGFFSQLAHELYNPLNGIIGFSDLMMRTGLPPKQEERAAAIASAARAMQQHIENVMTVHGEARLPADPALAATDIARLVRDFVRREAVRPSGGATNIVLGFQQAAGIWARSDPATVAAILQRLIAVAGDTPDTPVLIGIGCARDRVELTVQDHASRTARQVAALRAALLGDGAECNNASEFAMAAADCLARGIDARLRFEATPWPGHMATLSLPALIPAENRRHTAERILLAEDDEICRMLIAEYAHICDVPLDMAENGEIAARMVDVASEAGQPYALVLMDLNMPVMDGFEAARRIRASGHDEDRLPIVAVSANCSADDAATCCDAGMQELIPKPFMADEFESCIVRWLSSMQLNAWHPAI